MENQNISKFSDQRAFGRNLSNVSTPSVQLKDGNDHNDKNPAFGSGIQDKDEPMDTNSSGSPGLFRGGPLPRIKNESMDTNSSGSPVISKGGPFSKIKDGSLTTKTPGSPGKLEDRPVLKSKDQSMDPKTPCTSQQFKDEACLKIKDVPKPTIKEEEVDDETITVYVRGPGNQRKQLQISRNASIDELIRAANAAFGFGHKQSNTYIVHAGKELASGTGQTVAKAGIQNYGELNLCVRTLGGQDIR